MIHTNQKIIKHKVGLLNLADELGNISKACKTMGVSRDTFYRYRDAVDEGGVEALLDQSRRVPNLKNRVDPAVEKAVLEYAVEDPAHGQARVSNELRKQGIFVSPSGVRSIWLEMIWEASNCASKPLKRKWLEKESFSPSPRSGHLSVRSWMMRPVVRLTQHTLATLVHRTLSMLEPLKVLAVFISRRMLILTPR